MSGARFDTLVVELEAILTTIQEKRAKLMNLMMPSSAKEVLGMLDQLDALEERTEAKLKLLKMNKALFL